MEEASENIKNIESRKLFLILISLSVFITLIIFLHKISQTEFSPDSWIYYILSKSIFTDFFRINVIRQFQVVTEYTTSFPPFYPILVSLFNKVLNLKIYGGVVLNFFVAVATLFLSVNISRVLFSESLTGILFYFTLLHNPDYLNELVAARSIPLTLFLIFTSFYIIIKNKSLKNSRYILIGTLAGLASLTRFDFIIAGVVLGIALYFTDPEKSFSKCLKYYLFYFLALSPWFFYSMIHFSKPFISDNSRQVMLAVPSFVTFYYPNPKLLTFIWNDPVLWINNFIHRVNFSGFIFIKSLVKYTVFIPLSVLVIIGLTKTRNNLKLFVSKEKEILKKFVLFFIVLLSSVFCIFATGYADFRYFLAINNFIILFLLFIAHRMCLKKISLKVLQKAFTAILSVALLIGTVVVLKDINSKSYNTIIENNMTANQYKNIISVLENLEGQPLILMDQSEKLGISDIYNLAAYSNIKILTTPDNINKFSLLSFISKYKIGCIYTQNPYWVEFIENNYIYKKIHTEGFYVYKILELKPGIIINPNCSIKRDPGFFNKKQADPSH